VPSISTTLALALRMAGRRATSVFGGSTARMRSGERPPNTVGRPLSSSTRRNEENNVSADSGMTPSTAVMIRESPICRESAGTGPGRNDDARNHDTSSRATTLTSAPSPASTTRAGRQVMRSRTIAPSHASVTWPTVAESRTRAIATNDWNTPGSSRWTTDGANNKPMTPPPRKPTKARTPTTKPWR